MKDIILATNNSGKINELRKILSPLNCIAQHTLGISSVDEIGLSFIENAILKARHASRLGRKPALADDSGLVVAALNGLPGIYSARFAGPEATDAENIELLLHKLVGVADEQRAAYFYCALAFVQHENDPAPCIATGLCHGLISHESYGDSGFGYDPVFYLPDFQCTFGQLSIDIKNTISHRAMALQELRKHWLSHRFCLQ